MTGRLDKIPEPHKMEETPITVEISWNKEDMGEVARAKETFEGYVRQGWFAFALRHDNKRYQIFEFDPELERVFLFPLVEGG
ncbi:MAG: hypothetical protein ACE5Z5_03645 [Candidatus Bathyarchaeia archaeon]